MKTISTLIAITLVFNLFSQTTVYNSSGKKTDYVREDIDLVFQERDIPIPKSNNREGIAAVVAAAVPTLIDLGFKITTNVLESRVKKFSGEYQVQKSYLQAGGGKIPSLTFIRKVKTGNDSTALKIVLEPKEIENASGFVYYVSSIELWYSKARWKSKHNGLDYSIEIIPTFLVDKEKKSQELAPINLTGIRFGKHVFSSDEAKYRTAFIPLPKGGLFLDAAIKIVEVNPAKIEAEKILEIYNKYKDDAVTIINKILPSEKEEKEEAAPVKTQSGDPDKTQGNEGTGSTPGKEQK